MQQTPFPEVNKLLEELLQNIKNILGDNLVGLYVYGSLVWGDFDPNLSDIDMLAVVSADVTEKQFDKLKQMHQSFTAKYKQWNDRIEVQYLSRSALRTFKEKTSPVATISPGEPLHMIEVGRHWLMNWYMVLQKGMTLYGPSPITIIEPITKEEFIQSVKEHTRSWNEWVKNMRIRKAQSYAILTLCRALYAINNGEQTSKRQAAEWTKSQLPQWATVIDNALKWREEKDSQEEDSEHYPKTVEFVNYVRSKILAE